MSLASQSCCNLVCAGTNLRGGLHYRTIVLFIEGVHEYAISYSRGQNCCVQTSTRCTRDLKYVVTRAIEACVLQRHRVHCILPSHRLHSISIGYQVPAHTMLTAFLTFLNPLYVFFSANTDLTDRQVLGGAARRATQL